MTRDDGSSQANARHCPVAAVQRGIVFRPGLGGLPLLALFPVPAVIGPSRDQLTNTLVLCAGVAGYLAMLSADGRARVPFQRGKLVELPFRDGQQNRGQIAL